MYLIASAVAWQEQQSENERLQIEWGSRAQGSSCSKACMAGDESRVREGLLTALLFPRPDAGWMHRSCSRSGRRAVYEAYVLVLSDLWLPFCCCFEMLVQVLHRQQPCRQYHGDKLSALVTPDRAVLRQGGKAVEESTVRDPSSPPTLARQRTSHCQMRKRPPYCDGCPSLCSKVGRAACRRKASRSGMFRAIVCL